MKTKIDTGARSSAIDVYEIQELPGNRVCFEVVLTRDESGERVRVVCPITRQTRIRSSNGLIDDRIIV